jgi:hypothetical protein
VQERRSLRSPPLHNCVESKDAESALNKALQQTNVASFARSDSAKSGKRKSQNERGFDNGFHKILPPKIFVWFKPTMKNITEVMPLM